MGHYSLWYIVGRGLRWAAGILLLGLVFVAPLAYGGTRQGGAGMIAASCLLSVLLWGGSCMILGHRPRLGMGVYISIIGVWLAAMVWALGWQNPTVADPFTVAHLGRIMATWPQSVVWTTAKEQIGLYLGLVLAAGVVIDLCSSTRYRLALQASMVGAGLVWAGWAWAQNITGATSIDGQTLGRMATYFCGSFYHHTAAGAYINSVWPVALGLGWALGYRRQAWAKTTSYIALGIAILMLATHASHISRAPQVVALGAGMLLGLSVWRMRPWGQDSHAQGNRTLVLGLVAIGLGAIALAQYSGKLPTIISRWQLALAPAQATYTTSNPHPDQWLGLMQDDLYVPTHTPGGPFFGVRDIAYDTALRAIQARPWWGHGPTQWPAAASHHTNDPLVRSFFQLVQFVHNDYLQWWVEWGVFGFLGLAGFLLGGVAMGLRYGLDPRHSDRWLYIGPAIALWALLLQALWDFPLQMPALLLSAMVLAAMGYSRPYLAKHQGSQ